MFQVQDVRLLVCQCVHDALTLSVVQVLHYLRKRLSAEDVRKLHAQVVDGMVMVSRERMASIGAFFEDTGSTAKPFEGEEVDWYW